VNTRSLKVVPLVQGAFYLASGLWPILHSRSFERATGPRHDRLLVKTLGAAVTVLGASLLLAAFRRPGKRTLVPLGPGTQVAMAAADTLYARKGRIRPTQVIDTIAELVMLASWLTKERRSHGT
jgi:hypothetical protein